MDKKWEVILNGLQRFASPLIDIVTLFLSIRLSKALVARFEAQDVWNVILILGAYLLMCLGIWVGKKLEPNPINTSAAEKSITTSHKSNSQTPAAITKIKGKDKQSSWVVAPAWFFSFFVLFMLAETAGVFNESTVLGSRLDEIVHRPLWLVLSILTFGLVILLFPLLLLKKPRPQVAFSTTGHVFWRSACVAAVNTMVLVTAVFWEWYLADAEPMELALGGKIFVFIFAYLIFLLFYAPRLALLALENDKRSITGYLILLGIILWRLMY